MSEQDIPPTAEANEISKPVEGAQSPAPRKRASRSKKVAPATVATESETVSDPTPEGDKPAPRPRSPRRRSPAGADPKADTVESALADAQARDLDAISETAPKPKGRSRRRAGSTPTEPVDAAPQSTDSINSEAPSTEPVDLEPQSSRATDQEPGDLVDVELQSGHPAEGKRGDLVDAEPQSSLQAEGEPQPADLLAGDLLSSSQADPETQPADWGAADPQSVRQVAAESQPADLIGEDPQSTQGRPARPRRHRKAAPASDPVAGEPQLGDLAAGEAPPDDPADGGTQPADLVAEEPLPTSGRPARTRRHRKGAQAPEPVEAAPDTSGSTPLAEDIAVEETPIRAVEAGTEDRTPRRDRTGRLRSGRRRGRSGDAFDEADGQILAELGAEEAELLDAMDSIEGSGLSIEDADEASLDAERLAEALGAGEFVAGMEDEEDQLLEALQGGESAPLGDEELTDEEEDADGEVDGQGRRRRRRRRRRGGLSIRTDGRKAAATESDAEIADETPEPLIEASNVRVDRAPSREQPSDEDSDEEEVSPGTESRFRRTRQPLRRGRGRRPSIEQALIDDPGDPGSGPLRVDIQPGVGRRLVGKSIIGFREAYDIGSGEPTGISFQVMVLDDGTQWRMRGSDDYDPWLEQLAPGEA